jgi:tetratricopeptide (TPR) repeat protein
MPNRALSLAFAVCLVLSGCAGMAPKNPQLDAGDDAVGKSQFRSAIKLYTQAIASGMLTNEEVLEAHLKRAHAYLQDAEYNTMADADLMASMVDASRARVLAPNFSSTIDLQATLYQRLGGYNEALALFQTSYRIDKSDPYWSLISIGETYRMMGDYDSALRYYNHILARTDVQLGMPIYYHRGLTFFASGRYREAIDSLSEGLKYQPDWAFAYVFRACSFARIGEYDRAMSDYNVAMATWGQAESEVGHTTNWKAIRDRLVAETSATAALARGVMPAIDPPRFCEQFPSYAVHRERSTLLPPAGLLVPLLGPILEFEMVIGD